MAAVGNRASGVWGSRKLGRIQRGGVQLRPRPVRTAWVPNVRRNREDPMLVLQGNAMSLPVLALAVPPPLLWIPAPVLPPSRRDESVVPVPAAKRPPPLLLGQPPAALQRASPRLKPPPLTAFS